MYTLRKALIKQETKTRLKNHGLMLDINRDEDTPNPQEILPHIFELKAVAKALGDGETDINTIVKNFAKTELERNIDYLEWRAVYQDDSDYVYYSLKPFDHLENGGLVGFICNPKCFEMANSQAEYDVFFNHQLKYHADWANNNTYRLYLISDSNEPGIGAMALEKGGLYDIGKDLQIKGAVDDEANKLIELAIALINNGNLYKNQNKWRTAEITFIVDEDNFSGEKEISHEVISAFDAIYRVKPAFGTISHKPKTQKLKVNMLISSLPTLRELHKQAKVDVLNKVVAAGVKRPHEPYCNWTSRDINLLVRVLFEEIKTIKVSSIHHTH
ncbi:MAG: hypothetical protein VYA60_05020 [Pseudomonadota bacterium]|nr:hypothetical protein [Pseudomonadota bacterium]